jgi:hypothetical protein
MNTALFMNPTTRQFKAVMVNKPSVLERYGRYAIVHNHPLPHPANATLLPRTKPDALFIDGAEVILGCNDLEDFEYEILGFIEQTTDGQKAA